MRGGEHQQHAEEHHMSGYASRVGVVDLHRRQRPDLTSLHVEETIHRQRARAMFPAVGP